MNDPTHSAWPEGTVRLEDLAVGVPAELQEACELANAAAYEICQQRNTCVVTSHALCAYLREAEGRDARLTRIEAHTFGRRGSGVSLGSAGDGTRRKAAGPGCWHGHLGVTCDGYLLDPTIDQANNDFIHLPPLVLPLPPNWDTPGWSERGHIMFTHTDGTFVRYTKYHRQVGWKSAGDARPSHWRPIVDLMMGSNRLWGKA